MFDDIGKKIKTLAKVVCVLGIIFSIIFGGRIMIRGFSSPGDDLFFEGVLIIVIGCISSWLSVFVLYGLGELIDKTSSIEKMMADEKAKKEKEEAERKLNEQKQAAEENIVICPNCGTKNDREDYYCQKCTTKLR